MNFKPRSGVWSLLVIVLSITTAFAADDFDAPFEPTTYRLDNYRSPTPATLDAKAGLTTAEAEALWKDKAAVFIDVLPHVPKPTALAPGTVWRDKSRADIPGSIWLPDTGYGALAAETETYFRDGLAKATGGDLSRKIVVYCLRDCWMSWNAAKRAKTYGYTQVLWYPDGTDGWTTAGLPLEDKKPLPLP
jgi:PQQ-dependent catabolism-associated CXXCW motif protein